MNFHSQWTLCMKLPWFERLISIYGRQKTELRAFFHACQVYRQKSLKFPQSSPYTHLALTAQELQITLPTKPSVEKVGQTLYQHNGAFQQVSHVMNHPTTCTFVTKYVLNNPQALAYFHAYAYLTHLPPGERLEYLQYRRPSALAITQQKTLIPCIM